MTRSLLFTDTGKLLSTQSFIQWRLDKAQMPSRMSDTSQGASTDTTNATSTAYILSMSKTARLRRATVHSCRDL